MHNKCNYDIWAEMVPTKATSKDKKLQKLQTGILKLLEESVKFQIL